MIPPQGGDVGSQILQEHLFPVTAVTRLKHFFVHVITHSHCLHVTCELFYDIRFLIYLQSEDLVQSAKIVFKQASPVFHWLNNMA